jgi:hypothetical protein
MSKSFLAQLPNDELYPGSNIVRRFTFKMINTRDSYALLARANNQLAAVFAGWGEQSALFQKKGRFECLSPHNIAA